MFVGVRSRRAPPRTPFAPSYNRAPGPRYASSHVDCVDSPSRERERAPLILPERIGAPTVQLPTPNVSYTLVVRYGRYVSRRLRREKLTELAAA